MHRRVLSLCVLLLLLATVSTGCGDDENYMTRDELINPESCKTCHPDHYSQWAGSMHAYAADDPVFLAMNKRGQRETNGELGSFCVNCHAPMAVKTGATVDGLNLESVPQHLKGVTCFFCHSVDQIEGDHNNPLRLAEDGVMRGGLVDPVGNGMHKMAYSPLHDRGSQQSSAMCGSCHDIVTTGGVHLERTFTEWNGSLFASTKPTQHLSCSACHMKADVPGFVADFPGVPERRPRDHAFPGVDVALTPWPDKVNQLDGIARDLFAAVLPKLCVGPGAGGTQIDYTLDNIFAGHMLPSGAGQDRRMWAEIVAYKDGAIIYQSGVVAEGDPVDSLVDADLWQIRDFTFKADGDPAHMFWDVATVTSKLLPPAVTNDPTDPAFNHSVTTTYRVLGQEPDRVTAQVHIRPMGLEVLDDLIASGDLDPAIRSQIPTFTLVGTVLEWTSGATQCVAP